MNKLHNNNLFYPLVATLTALALGLRIVFLPFVADDMPNFYFPWYDYILSHGRFLALKNTIGLYTPPNYYFLAAVSYLDGLAGKLYLIKSIPIIFDFAAAFFIYKIALKQYEDQRTSLIAALVFLNLPSVVLEGSCWGQYDIIFVTCMLAAVLALLENRIRLALIWIGVSIAFKLPAVFLLPLVGVLILDRRISLIELLIIPAAYVAMMIPAVAVGRPLTETLLVYFGQFGFAQLLVEDAPNPYMIVKRLHFIDYKTGVATGMTITIVGLIGAMFLLRSRIAIKDAKRVLLGAAFFTTLAPYLLPKMHDRYIFSGDIFVFAFVAINPRAWPLAVLFEVTTVLAYSKVLWWFHHGPDFALLSMTATLALLTISIVQLPPSPQARSRPAIRLV
jgi:Gpi18-like mannosyltransferase